MDRARVAALLRELLAEVESDDVARPKSKLRPEATARLDDVTRARIRSDLRRKGYRNVG